MSEEQCKKDTKSTFASTEEDAASKYETFGAVDPFPEIPSALLNSADIEDYVAATGMIYPFDSTKLLPASYEIGFEGDVYLWNERGEEVHSVVDRKKPFILPRNSIAFVFLKTKFRIPDYIALRFNLRIRHVHRGILLGTGPLVDPGFIGNLLIPLHNLTTNDYKFIGGEGFIWLEFTKLSPHQCWTARSAGPARNGQYRTFPKEKMNRTAYDYFADAASGMSIRSSIPDAVQKSAENAENARMSAERSERRTRRFTVGGSIGVILAVLTLYLGIYIGFQPVLQLVQGSVEYMTGEREQLSDRQEEQSKIIEGMRSRLKSLEEANKELSKHMDRERQRVLQFESDLRSLRESISNLDSRISTRE